MGDLGEEQRRRAQHEWLAALASDLGVKVIAEMPDAQETGSDLDVHSLSSTELRADRVVELFTWTMALSTLAFQQGWEIGQQVTLPAFGPARCGVLFRLSQLAHRLVWHDWLCDALNSGLFWNGLSRKPYANAPVEQQSVAGACHSAGFCKPAPCPR